MASEQALIPRVREAREARGWSQQELADRSGLSRTGVGAIETGRVTPSIAAGLALARALGRPVEELFVATRSREPRGAAWAWTPSWREGNVPVRYWEALRAGRRLRYPVEPTYSGVLPHDGVWNGKRFKSRTGSDQRTAGIADPERTVVLAGCDPAANLLSVEAARQEGLRVIPLARSSGNALALLAGGLVHGAGIHLGHGGGEAASGNASAAREALGSGCELVRVAEWEEGVIFDPRQKIRSLSPRTTARLEWIGRDPGSGAQQCLDEILAGAPAPRHFAGDHRGVVEAIRSGHADAGVSLRLVGEEAGLAFLEVRRQPYDLCVTLEFAEDWRFAALQRVIQSASYRSLLGDLPGYDSRSTGQVERVG